MTFNGELTMIVALDGGHTFTCVVGPWDTTDDDRIGDEEALRIARGLVYEDRVPLAGELDGQSCTTIIDPERVITLGLTPAAATTTEG